MNAKRSQGEEDGEGCGGRTACVSPVSCLLLPLSLPIFFFASTLSAGRGEKADNPLRRAFSRPAVKGKGAIAEGLSRLAVSAPRETV